MIARRLSILWYINRKNGFDFSTKKSGSRLSNVSNVNFLITSYLTSGIQDFYSGRFPTLDSRPLSIRRMPYGQTCIFRLGSFYNETNSLKWWSLMLILMLIYLQSWICGSSCRFNIGHFNDLLFLWPSYPSVIIGLSDLSWKSWSQNP